MHSLVQPSPVAYCNIAIHSESIKLGQYEGTYVLGFFLHSLTIDFLGF